MKRILFLLSLPILFAVFMPSCKRDVITSPGNSFQTVKVYNDSLITNPFTIVAGTNKLVMSYQTILYPTQSMVMATDNKGVLLWKTPITTSGVTDILIQNDGSYTLIGSDYNTLIYMYNLNSAGNITATYSFMLPPGFSTSYEFFIYYGWANIIRTATGNNVIWGNYYDFTDINNYVKSFIMECDNSGNMLWTKNYYFPQTPKNDTILEATYITNGVITPDGGFLFCGYVGSKTTSQFFLMKTDAQGNSLWTKFHTTGAYNTITSQTTPYGANTSSLIPLNNGNYALFIGPSVRSVNPSEWIYTFSPTGDSLSSTQLDFPVNNYPAQAIMNSTGGFFAVMNQTNTTFTGAHGVVPQNTCFESLNPNLSLLSQGYFQTIYPDYFQSLCLTSDGNIACFGMIQSEGKNYYKPELIITNGQ